MTELLPCVHAPRFNMGTLASTPSCMESVRDIILKVWTNLQFDTEEELVQKVIQLICCETAEDLIGIRRCEALCYDLIISLERDQENAFHHSKGETIRRRGER